VAKPDDEAGEVPKAFIVLREERVPSDALAQEIMTWVRGRVAPHKRIRNVEFIDQVPRTAAGKILRRVLKAAPAPERSSRG
jgi:acyl-coenzyme A synthetase/AMP-(fatty) acid ligase